jgi:hypothetical protein
MNRLEPFLKQALAATEFGQPAPSITSAHLACLTVLCGGFYGSVMGSFSGLTGDHVWQIVFVAIKVPLLLTATLAISLPSFFVISTLLGVRTDFAASLRAILSSQACLAIVLASLAPYTLLWYASFDNYRGAILINAFMFALSSFTSQGVLRRLYRQLIARNPQHRHLLRLWLILYAFVGIQMGWILRPFIGEPGLPRQFFRADQWGNAYLIVARIIWDTLAQLAS